MHRLLELIRLKLKKYEPVVNVQNFDTRYAGNDRSNARRRIGG
jgi:hypothetical protein